MTDVGATGADLLEDALAGLGGGVGAVSSVESGWERYARQIGLPEIGEDGQLRLARSCVLLAGAGGLGSAAGFYLAAAGFGRIVIVDPDVVALSNLNRQILYAAADVGLAKAPLAAERLSRLNPAIEVVPLALRIEEANVSSLLRGVDLVVDGLDNFTARLVLASAAYAAGIAFIHAGIRGWSGQLTTFLRGASPCLECLSPRNPAAADAALFKPVLGAAAGMAGALQAAEAVKLVTGAGRPLHGRLLRFCVLSMRFDEIPFKGRTRCAHCANPTI